MIKANIIKKIATSRMVSQKLFGCRLAIEIATGGNWINKNRISMMPTR